MTDGNGSVGNGAGIAFVYVCERERALAFYRDGLGLAVTSSDDYGDNLASSAGQLRITVMPDHQPSPHPAAGWEVEDILATVQALEAQGIAMSRWDGMGQDEHGITTAEDGGKMAFFADPDGNALMLVQN